MFLPPLKKTIYIFHIHLKHLENQGFHVNKFVHWFICVCCHFKNVLIEIFIDTLLNSGIFQTTCANGDNI
jgi:hypothetical protein